MSPPSFRSNASFRLSSPRRAFGKGQPKPLSICPIALSMPRKPPKLFASTGPSKTSLHYVRDVTLCEDASRIRKNPGIFARIRSFAYNILRFNQSDTIPQDRYAAALGGLESLFLNELLYRALNSPRTAVYPRMRGERSSKQVLEAPNYSRCQTNRPAFHLCPIPCFADLFIGRGERKIRWRSTSQLLRRPRSEGQKGYEPDARAINLAGHDGVGAAKCQG